MDQVLTWIAGIVGGGGALTLIAAGVLYVTKGAIAKAVSQAGERELARLKGDLDKEAVKHKAELDRDLEQFKAQLTLEAEVRRRVAEKKVAVILRFIELGNELVQKALFPVFDLNNADNFQKTIKALDEYWGAYREGEVFFDANARTEIFAFGKEVEATRDAYTMTGGPRPSIMAASARAETARARFFQTLRRELQIEMGEKVETKSS